MRRVAGVDGGGTRMRAVIADEAARELGRGESVGAVVGVDPHEDVAGRIAEAVRAAAAAAETPLPVGTLWAGLAGAGRVVAQSAVARELRATAVADEVVVGTDVEAAFRAAFGSGPGILLIAGTGSIAWARDATGEVIRAGGWGEHLGDEGSGYAIGAAALRAVAQAEDGRGPATSLTGLVLDHLSLDSPEGLIAWSADASKRDVAALAPTVAAAAEAGDAVGRAIKDAAVAALSSHVTAILERGKDWGEAPELVCWGGLLVGRGALSDAMADLAASQHVRLSTRSIDPAMGAAKMALGTRPAGAAEA